MQYDQRHSKPIIICLNDSIFKDKHSQWNQKQQKKIQKRSDEHHNNQNIHKTIIKNYYAKNHGIQYLNGSYFGKTTHNKSPQGSGIFIDDQFNFFLSNWKQNHKMNGLTLSILLNGIKLYGTWVQGKPNGWNCIEMKKGLKIFVQLKTSIDGKSKVQSPVLMIDEVKKIAYLIQVELSQSMYTKIKILNRKQVHQLFTKHKDITFIDPKDIFEQIVDLKIPHFLFSFEDFLMHLNQNIQDIQIKQVQKHSQRFTFLSIKEEEIWNKKLKSECFIPFPQLLKANQKLSEKSNRKLGILLNRKSNKTKAIGEFSHGFQLTGRGLSFTSSSSNPLFGIFKSDMLVRQFQHSQPFQTKYLQSRQLKKQLTKYHMKSVNFKNDLVYFHQVDQMMNLMNQIVQFVDVFEQEYSKRYEKEIDSFAQSQNQFEQRKYFNQQNNDMIKLNKEKSDNQIKFQEHKNVFVKRKDSFESSSKKLRPFGKIVNSRSPLRQIPSHSHSKSPSQTQTYRQRKPYPSPNVSSKKSFQKDLMISINQSSNHVNNKYNIETIRNKSKSGSQKYDNDINRKARYFLAHNQQRQKQEDVMQTIRIKNESNIKSQYKRNSMEQLTNNFYSRHLRNNYIDHR